jgi:hypothetical protein
MKIDVEGAEAQVLAGADWGRWRPRVVVLEAVAPGTMAPAWDEWEPILLGNGYRFGLFDGLNRFYVAEEEPELAARLPKEKADWGAVPHLWGAGRAPESPDHPDHALARALVDGFLARLPLLDHDQIAEFLAIGGGAIPDGSHVRGRGDALPTALGRIASRYDGGFPPE